MNLRLTLKLGAAELFIWKTFQTNLRTVLNPCDLEPSLEMVGGYMCGEHCGLQGGAHRFTSWLHVPSCPWKWTKPLEGRGTGARQTYLPWSCSPASFLQEAVEFGWKRGRRKTGEAEPTKGGLVWRQGLLLTSLLTQGPEGHLLQCLIAHHDPLSRLC